MQPNAKKVCGIYTRVSSQGQVEEGYSLDEQKQLLIEHAEKQGYEVYDIYTDPGISAKDIAHRPQIQRLINDMEEGRINVICAWKLSRTFRCLNELTTVMEVMKANNVIFDFKSEGILDLNTTTGKLQAQILGMVAEMERDNIADNVYMGMAAAAKQGKYLAGTAPFGYDLVRSTGKRRGTQHLVINDQEAPVVMKIFEMFVEDQIGYKGIANYLNKAGYKTKQGKLFSIGTVSGIINNPIYMGVIRWGAHRKWSEKRRKGTTEPILAKGEHEPLITEEVYNKAQAIRISRGGKVPRKHNSMNILTGILRCPECDSGMVLAHIRSKGEVIRHAYCCSAFHNFGSCACHSNMVDLDETNAVVLDKVAELCNDELIIRGVLKRLNRNQHNKIEGSEKDKEDLEKLLEKTQRDIASLQRRFESDTCDMDPADYKKKIKELRTNEETYKGRLAEVKVSIGKYQAEKVYTIEELREVFVRIRNILGKADVVELRTLMHLMIEQITIDSETRKPDSMIIKFNKVLTDYLCINNEEEANKASSFSIVKHKELVFKVDL